MALNDSMRIVFMGGPVPVPVLEAGAYAGGDAVCVNAQPAIQPPGRQAQSCRLFVFLSAGTACEASIAGKEKAAGNQRLFPNSLGVKK
ncbi:hypothetical protein [Xanthomonas citri]|nr:hypothetical protein [Xanthomonas citri]UZB09396.1 hypothetical protein OM953_07065 [Xanthomonas citri pv. fuscans]